MKGGHLIALVAGTRPEAIKLAPVYRHLGEKAGRFEAQLWVTGQHRHLLDQVLETFALKPHRDLNLMRPGQSLADITCAVLTGLQTAFSEKRPDMIMVQGDTTTAFAAALAGFYAGIKVAHVEAGLRTWNRFAPYPEEVNRQMVSCLADFHFAPTAQAQKNLERQGVPADRIWVTGNTVIDALDIMVKQVRRAAPVFPPDFPVDSLADGRRMILITGHRRENFGSGFESICRAIALLAGRYPEYAFIYPVHLNPNVREPVSRLLQGKANVHLIEPLPYEPFVWAMDRAYLLLTDSGGVQEEAPHLGKPVLVLRDTTERPEALEAGTALLVGTDVEKIVATCTNLMNDTSAYAAMSRAVNPFGDGHAAERIVAALESVFVNRNLENT
jgi:UDP-N-acetylglucosamine 2-epimerase (non-hydrolysing)